MTVLEANIRKKKMQLHRSKQSLIKTNFITVVYGTTYLNFTDTIYQFTLCVVNTV